ncbi:Hypothetical protein LUCI_1170 [Lucifera butyrica]|uniref:HlyC/CorC family transporter n=1 Tax=Lucifera butyrica TaxID=1351585 RepID=A0A498R480_9FIRM|nr:Hypothetical protein LUCI_1170 [Lucifera butyrica]
MTALSPLTQAFILFLLILANGLFSLTEMSIISSRKSRLEQLAEAGDPGAKTALELSGDPTQMLSTIQSGITLISILTGTFGSAGFSRLIAEQLRVFPFLEPYADILSLVIVISSITYISLLLGELVPKRLALANPEPIAAVLSRPMQTFSRLSSPVVRFLTYSTNQVLRLLAIQPAANEPVTEEEIKILIEQGTEAGMFEKAEQDMVEQIFQLSDARAHSLMIPRTQIVWLDVEDPWEENFRVMTENYYSRFPIARKNLDDFIGIIHTNQILTAFFHNKPVHLEQQARPALFVPESMKVLKVLELFKQSGTHEAIVLDEFGGVAGMITLREILEEIFGDVSRSEEADNPQAVQREDNSWLVDGLLSTDDFKETFAIDALPEEKANHYQTLGGFVTWYLGRIPTAAEYFEWNGLRFEIVDMDRVRVDKVLVTRIQDSSDFCP